MRTSLALSLAFLASTGVFAMPEVGSAEISWGGIYRSQRFSSLARSLSPVTIKASTQTKPPTKNRSTPTPKQRRPRKPKLHFQAFLTATTPTPTHTTAHSRTTRANLDATTKPVPSCATTTTTHVNSAVTTRPAHNCAITTPTHAHLVAITRHAHSCATTTTTTHASLDAIINSAHSCAQEAATRLPMRSPTTRSPSWMPPLALPMLSAHSETTTSSRTRHHRRQQRTRSRLLRVMDGGLSGLSSLLHGVAAAWVNLEVDLVMVVLYSFVMASCCRLHTPKYIVV